MGKETTIRKKAASSKQKTKAELAKEVDALRRNVMRLQEGKTKAKEVETTRQEQDPYSKGIIASALDAIITVDHNQRIVLFNAAAQEMFRCSADKALGKSLDQFIPERFRAAHRAHIRKFGGTKTKTRKMVPIGEITGLRADGEEFPADATICQVEAAGKKRFTAILRDLTERKKDEKALSESRNQNDLILQCAGEGINGMDAQGKITFVNPFGAAMIGRKIEELIGQDRHSIFHHSRADGTPYPVDECPIYASLRDGAVHLVDSEVFWKKDGSSVPVEYVSTPIRDGGSTIIGAVVTFRDITERKNGRGKIERERIPSQ